ncbi:MAG: heparan-alpha-glucosaminide N-acetyltransferase domain-containing protein [Lachnospiraceae bacterium]|nr:heparan-alpha-glucosaminide N-acetyltransferase domain-containing protein [Lachnospiraceae bacterium]
MKNKRNVHGIFSDTQVNTGRQRELDLAKAMAILCLAPIHCIIECTPEEGLISGIPYLFDTIIGGPLSAPMYMFAMGIGMAYSRKHTWQSHAKRGLMILAAGYLLNLCRSTLPCLIAYALTGNAEKYLTQLPYLTFMNDIFQFAGLAMLVMAFFIWLRLPEWEMLAIGIIASLTASAIGTVDMENPVLNVLLGYLIGTEDAAGLVCSDFPLLHWMIVPIIGYLFGGCLRHVRDKRRFYRMVSPVCAILAVAWFARGIYYGLGMFGEGQNCYYHISTPDVTASLLAAVAMLGGYYAISDRIPAFLLRFASEVSRNISKIYFIHWVLIGLIIRLALSVVRGTQELPVGLTVLLGAAISALAVAAAHGWSIWQRGCQKRETA